MTRSSWPITLLKIIFMLLLIALANIGVSWIIDGLGFQFYPISIRVAEQVMVAGAILYIGLMASPFLPGIEVGVIFMMLLGWQGTVLIYLCTLIALTLSFGIGRILPPHILASFLGWLHMSRAEHTLREFDATPPEERLKFITEKTSTGATPSLLKRRYWLLAGLLNMPGNVVIGGAGGIAMLAGMSRLYSFPKYLLLIAVAILPGPVLITLSKFVS